MQHGMRITSLFVAVLLLSASAVAQFGIDGARRSAENYLSFMAFSRTGLIDQLVFEGYAREDATSAVNATHANWFEQAARSAQQYLEMTAFSVEGLIDQLLFEGFTIDEARYGANVAYGNDAGLAPSASGGDGQAERLARSYLTVSAFSREGLIDQLVFEGFTLAEAETGVAALNVDWNDQAVRKARSYLSFMPFSRQGLMDQLLFEGFTRAQASHAIEQVSR